MKKDAKNIDVRPGEPYFSYIEPPFIASIFKTLRKLVNLYNNLSYICRCSQTAGRNSYSISSGDVSNLSYRLKAYPVTSSRLSLA